MTHSKGESTTVPPRIHVLLARVAPYGVVVRRGPSRHVCFVGWDRSTDQFTLGQWLKGRIYPLRSDISPDGRHVIYFATDGVRPWTAISRAPYLKAIGLWKQGHHYNGGGMFDDNEHYWFNSSFECVEEQLPSRLTRSKPREDSHGIGECTTVYFPRLQRDGWEQIAQEKRHGDHVTVFEKRVTSACKLRKFFHASINHPHGRGVYWDEHELENFGAVYAFPEWEWADVDGDRLVWAEHGRIFAGRIGDDGPPVPVELYDFNPMTFEAIKAPY